jgi:hypothetical protein
MRPGQNKRMRGRPANNRRGPNPLTRSYESNGPDVKIRGNAHHVAEKYLQLARDAHTGGDPVAAENYLQHAEHYFRLIAAAQAAQAAAQSGQPRGPTDEGEDLEDDDDFGGLSDRFASPTERASGTYQPQGGFQPQPSAAPNASQPYVDRPAFDPDRQQGQNDRGGFSGRQDRPNNRFQDRAPRPDRSFPDRGEGYRDSRQNRDVRSREFRPYRDPASQTTRDSDSAGTTALPPFITAGPKLPVPETAGEGEPIGTMQTAAEQSLNPIDTPNPAIPDAVPQDGRFPGRGRRRRLRSPYGFNASQGDLDSQGPSTVSDETPVTE